MSSLESHAKFCSEILDRSEILGRSESPFLLALLASGPGWGKALKLIVAKRSILSVTCLGIEM